MCLSEALGALTLLVEAFLDDLANIRELPSHIVLFPGRLRSILARR